MGNIDKSRKKPEQAVRQALRITASSNPMRDAMAFLALLAYIYINESNVVVIRHMNVLANHTLLLLVPS
jgi:ribosomal protein S12